MVFVFGFFLQYVINLLKEHFELYKDIYNQWCLKKKKINFKMITYHIISVEIGVLKLTLVDYKK